MRIEVAGENALIIYFADETNPEVSAQIQTTCIRLEQALGGQLIDLIPSYASLLVIYDALQCDDLYVRQAIRNVSNNASSGDSGAPAEHSNSHDSSLSPQSMKSANLHSKVIELPVWYDTESGPDLEAMSKRTGLSIDELIKIHQSSDYRVYAIGFAPGFAYLGQVDERIAAPRLDSPRLKVPRGAVAIADRQTAVYPDVSPGGWNLIGLCPTRMFNPQATPTMPVGVGDSVRFKAIGRDEFLELGGEIPEVIA